MNASLNTILADLDAIGLDELNERAAMLTRVDRKYALDATQASAILSRLPEETRVLQIAGQVSQCYASTYYDTPDMDSYLLTALKRRRRFKVRARTYLSTGASFLEVKTRGPRGLTVKKRMPISWDAAGAPLAGERRSWVAGKSCMAAIAVPYLEIFTGRTPPSHRRWSTMDGVAPDFVSMMTRSGRATSVPSVRSERHVSFVSTVARPAPPGRSRVLRS